MNLRTSVHEYSIPGYEITRRLPTGFFGSYKEHKIWIDSRYETKETLEYLDPKDTKWKPLPKVYECTDCPTPKDTAD